MNTGFSGIQKRIIILLASLLLAFSGCRDSDDNTTITVPDTEDTTETPITIFSDDFNRTDGALGSEWTVTAQSGDSFNIEGNRARPVYTSGGDTPFAAYSQIITDNLITISVKLIASGGDSSGDAAIYAFSSNKTNWQSNSFSCGFFKDNGASHLTIYRWDSNGTVASTIATSTSAVNLTDGESATLTFKLEMSTFTCTLSGSTTITASGNSQVVFDGYAGMVGGSLSGNHVYFDDYSIIK